MNPISSLGMYKETQKAETRRRQFLKKAADRGEFVQEVDGFVYWLPNESQSGIMASHHLRWIAGELDRRNEQWNREINAALSPVVDPGLGVQRE
jgi:hypothetical protein